VVRGGGKARGRVLRCQAVTASTRTCPSSSTLCLKGSMRNFPRPLIVRVSWSPPRRRYEIRAPANPPPHRPRRTPGLHPGGFSDTPLDDPQAPRARDDGTLAKALLPTPSSASLRGLAPGCAGEVIFHARARPRVVDRVSKLELKIRSLSVRSTVFSDRETRRSRKTLRDRTSSMAPRRQNSTALQRPCARAQRPDEPEPLPDASKLEPHRWHVQPDPGVGGTDPETPAAGGTKVVPLCRMSSDTPPSRPPRNRPRLSPRSQPQIRSRRWFPGRSRT
jgi:hypothetical protein